MAYNGDILPSLSSSTRERIIYLFAALGAGVGCYLFLYAGIPIGTLFYLAPLLILTVICCFSYPIFCFFVLYSVAFLVPGMSRYIDFPIPPGLVIDLLIAVNILIIGLQRLAGNKVGRLYLTPFLLMSLAWMFYCFFQAGNPMSNLSNWSTTVRSIGIHILVLQVLVFCILDKSIRLHYFFNLWAALVILAALKAIGQKHLGFDGAEAAWVYGPGAHTHIIYSGIRYFSFFTDAANFGCHMGLGFVVFSILAFFEQSRGRQIFYILVALLAAYGMMISGTRAAMAVPFVGFAFFVVLLKQWKWLIAGSIFLLLALAFFNYTTIGNSSADIRRMRTAFQFSKDASFNVRLENQKKMRTFMKDHPFGLGMGSSKNSVEGDLIHGIATDSSFVFIWIETGIVGLVFYVILCLSILGFGLYYAMARLRNPVIKGMVIASTSGLAGIMVAGYANEILHQVPTGQTVYILMGIIMLSPFVERKESHASNGKC